ncbi:hypothetical protein KY363_08360 [Candidatus Woesearchaeota archaeon]|nr:hypothetical protein [Candidatus Woesearchaeota archaeon]
MNSLIDPASVSNWSAYYSSVKSLDDAVNDSMQQISDACEMITAFTDKAHYDIVTYFSIRWIRMKLKRERYRVDAGLPYVYEILTAYAAESAMDVSPKIAAGANEIMGAYENTVNKLHAYGAAVTDSFNNAQKELASKTLLWKIREEEPDALVYIALDDVHYLRLEYSSGFDRETVVTKKLRKDRTKRDEALKKEGERLSKSVYVLENPADNVSVELMVESMGEWLEDFLKNIKK